MMTKEVLVVMGALVHMIVSVKRKQNLRLFARSICNEFFFN